MGQVQLLQEPKEKRAVAFFDGQNLYRQAKTAFGHHYPNYDPQKLHAAIYAKQRDGNRAPYVSIQAYRFQNILQNGEDIGETDYSPWNVRAST